MNTNAGIDKLPTFVPGLDHVTDGGLPLGRATLVSGTAGSSKTVLAAQFLAEGIRHAGQHGVFVTFEETAEDIRRNLHGLGWDIGAWEKAGKWAFVDASPATDVDAIEVGDFDLDALMVRIRNAVSKVGAQRLSVDSIGAIFSQFTDSALLRRELFQLTNELKRLGVTAMITAERIEEYGAIARHGIEEFVADNVIVLRNVLVDHKRRRTIEVLKFRGTRHRKGEYPFTVLSDEGVVVIPLSAMELTHRSSNVRISSGSADLDHMCDGGFFRDAIVLVSGSTGTGKTLVATEFVSGGIRAGERCLIFAFEESRQQLLRNATSWGVEYEEMERQGLLKIICQYPESASLEDHLIAMRREIGLFKPQRVAIDSLSALERVATDEGFRQFVIALTSFLKQHEIAGLFTAATPELFGGGSITDAHVSTITDCIILLRYVEIYGAMRRGLTVLKMRGSRHDKDIREFLIDDTGMHLGKSFRHVVGILAGVPRHASAGEIETMRTLFGDS